MADLLSNGDAAVRAADALLRGNGGCSVLLRMAAPAASGDAEQLGLATPQFQDAELAPVAFRKAESTAKLLVSGSAVKAMLDTLAFDSADVLFETAIGIVVNGVVFLIESSVASVAAGEPYCYCLTLKAPVR